MNPVIFTIYNIDIKWYSVCILLGVICAYAVIINESKHFGIKSEFMFNIMFWALIFGILGARIYYVLFNLEYYLDNLSEIYKIWNGGLAIHGGIIFGLITIIIYCKKYKANILRILDIIVPALIIAQAIGRWGNFFNSEAYGSIVTYQTLIKIRIIPQFIIDNMYINGSYHLPMFYFESLWCLLGFIIMLIIRRRKYIKVGQVTSFYLIWYGFSRAIIEIFRTDSLMIGNVKVAIVVSVLMVIVGIVISLIQGGKPKLDELYNSNKIEDIKF